MDSTAANAPFPATRWTLVVSARGEVSHQALGELCRLYWMPLYTFARRQGWNPEDAADMTQDFFRALIEKKEAFLSELAPEHGRLRTFFLKVFQRRLIDAHRYRTRGKRGGPSLVPISLDEAEAWLAAETGLSTDPERAFARRWALTVLDTALGRLARDFEAAGKSAQFEALQPSLGLEEELEFHNSRLESLLGLTPAAARQAVSRFRERFRFALRTEIAGTLQDPDEAAIDAELHELKAALR